MVYALAGKSQDVDTAQTMLQRYKTNNAPKAMVDDAQAKLAAAHKEFNDLGMRVMTPQTYMLSEHAGVRIDGESSEFIGLFCHTDD